MAIKSDDIIILLGAGCSIEAGIPTSSKMIQEIEKPEFLNAHSTDHDYSQLYYYIKSAIIYGQGIQGRFDSHPNIEDLINVLSELEKRENNLVYPFIANWNNLLINLAGLDFKCVSEFKSMIHEKLKSWVRIDNYKPDASYYERFYSFQKELEHPLRVFSLNYDMCFEHLKPDSCNLELGFDENNYWNYARFEDTNIEAAVYLYKLHGSIDWKRENAQLKKCDTPTEDPELIFGVPDKLQSYDPYLFYIYELRQYSLGSKLIVVIGYGFGDDHINDLMRQALQANPDRKLLCVTPCDEESKQKEFIKNALELDSDGQIIIANKKAKDFLENDLNKNYINPFIASDEEEPFS